MVGQICAIQFDINIFRQGKTMVLAGEAEDFESWIIFDMAGHYRHHVPGVSHSVWECLEKNTRARFRATDPVYYGHLQKMFEYTLLEDVYVFHYICGIGTTTNSSHANGIAYEVVTEGVEDVFEDFGKPLVDLVNRLLAKPAETEANPLVRKLQQAERNNDHIREDHTWDFTMATVWEYFPSEPEYTYEGGPEWTDPSWNFLGLMADPIKAANDLAV